MEETTELYDLIVTTPEGAGHDAQTITSQLDKHKINKYKVEALFDNLNSIRRKIDDKLSVVLHNLRRPNKEAYDKAFKGLQDIVSEQFLTINSLNTLSDILGPIEQEKKEGTDIIVAEVDKDNKTAFTAEFDKAKEVLYKDKGRLVILVNRIEKVFFELDMELQIEFGRIEFEDGRTVTDLTEEEIREVQLKLAEKLEEEVKDRANDLFNRVTFYHGKTNKELLDLAIDGDLSGNMLYSDFTDEELEKFDETPLNGIQALGAESEEIIRSFIKAQILRGRCIGFVKLTEAQIDERQKEKNKIELTKDGKIGLTIPLK